MLPGLPAPSSPHAVTSNNTSSSPTSRSRLRGLSYLRSYASAHGSHHHSNNNNSNNNNNHTHSPAAPVVVTATNASTASPAYGGRGGAGQAPVFTAPTGRRASPGEQQASRASTNAGSISISTSTMPARGAPIVTTSPWAIPTPGYNPSVPHGHALSSSAPSAHGVVNPAALQPRSDSKTNQGAPVRSIGETLTGAATNPPAVRAPTTGAPAPPRLNGAAPEPPIASIRFTPHIDIRSPRESLTFTPIERVLRTGEEVIRVGRYSERDIVPNPRDANGINTSPVGFKSKVVSRRHCEFWFEKNQWYVKDVKSSSGTFLNHIRLSGPGNESRPFAIYDGDILQLGIDFKGGEEPIFRCVKIRVELNRAWQKGLNQFK